MADNYINKIKKNGVEYLIHATNTEIKLYRHEVRIDSQLTISLTLTTEEKITKIDKLIEGAKISLSCPFLDRVRSFIGFGYDNGYYICFINNDELIISKTWVFVQSGYTDTVTEL